LEELGMEKRNPFILNMITAMRDLNKPINFEEFLDVVCSKVG
jgi:Ca2+-binding EF-hand superfamily protein